MKKPGLSWDSPGFCVGRVAPVANSHPDVVPIKRFQSCEARNASAANSHSGALRIKKAFDLRDAFANQWASRATSPVFRTTCGSRLRAGTLRRDRPGTPGSPLLSEEEARRHIEVILPAVLRILPANLSFEFVGAPNTCRNPFQILEVGDFCFGVL